MRRFSVLLPLLLRVLLANVLFVPLEPRRRLLRRIDLLLVGEASPLILEQGGGADEIRLKARQRLVDRRVEGERRTRRDAWRVRTRLRKREHLAHVAGDLVASLKVRGVPEESFNPKQLIAVISKLTAIFDPARSAIAAVRLVLKEKETEIEGVREEIRRLVADPAPVAELVARVDRGGEARD